MAGDGHGNVLLFGGADGTGIVGDTWLWDGVNWRQLTPATSPPVRVNASMAVDSNGKVVLFGGFRPGFGALSDTWLWDGSNWTQASPSTSPPGRYFASMAPDVNGNVLLFGGNGAMPALGDTWLWNGTNWTQPVPGSTPSGRAGAMTATADGTVVLFGGINASTLQFMNDTWRWNGSSWAADSPSTSPAARYGGGMATDANGKIVLFGGQDLAGNFNDTWLFNVQAKGPAELLADLGKAVAGVGPGTSLADKVSAGQADLASDDVAGTCSLLRAFINEVKAQTGKSIPTDRATSLIVDATQIRVLLGC
jgi:hypothetical protein